jgi:hypothetical protein
MLVGQGQILVLIIILVIGMLIGAAVAWWLASNRKTNAPDPENDHLTTLRTLYLEQASLWRERASGKLNMLVGDQMVGNPKQLNATQIKGMQVLAKDWSTWLGIPAITPVPVPPQPEPVLITPSPTAATEHPLDLAPRPISVALTSPIVQTPAVPTKPKSIVEQINDILQAKLVDSPVRNKGVRLVEDPVHGVIVWIGIEHFNGVDQVKDPEVKALLREAAAEWEQHALPGPMK